MDIVAWFLLTDGGTFGRTYGARAGAGAGAMGGGSIDFRGSDSERLEFALITNTHPIIRTIATIEIIITAELIVL